MITRFPSPFRQFINWWNSLWHEELPAGTFSPFRIAHGLSLFLFLAAWWLHAPEWIGADSFHYPDAPFPPLPNPALPWFGFLQFSALLLFIIGWRVRLTAAITWLCLLYVTGVDRVSAYSINSIYLFTFAVMAVFPTSGRPRIEVTPIRLLQTALIVIYFSSGWHKAVFGDWLDSPTVLENAMKGIYMTDFAAWALRTFPAWVWTATQYGVLAFELFSPVLFISGKLRWLGIALGCAFHIGIALFMDQLIYFSLQMMTFYLLFVKPPPVRIFRSAQSLELASQSNAPH